MSEAVPWKVDKPPDPAERRKKLSRIIAAERKNGLTFAEAVQLRADLERDIERGRRQATPGDFVRRNLRRVGKAALHVGNAATFGYLPQLAAPLGTFTTPSGLAGAEGREEVRGALEAALQASEDTDPMAATAGKVGGFLSPSGGPMRLANLAARAATGARVVPTIAGAGVALRSTADLAAQATGGVVRRGLAEVGNAIAGGSAAVGAIRAVEDRDRPTSLAERLAQAADAATDPVVLGTSAVLGAGAGAFRMQPEANLHRIIREAQRRGITVPAYIPRDSAGLRSLYDTIKVSPGMAGKFERYAREQVVLPLRQWVQEIASGGRGAPPTTQGTRAGGAAAVRRMAGTEASTLGAEQAGAVSLARQGRQAAAFAQQGGTEVPAAAQQTLVRELQGWNRQRRADPTLGKRGSDLRQVRRDMARAIASAHRRGRNLTYQQLENLRLRLSGAAQYQKALPASDPANAAASIREASDLYATVRAAQSTGNLIDDALTSGERLRRMEDSLEGVRLPEMGDDATLQAFFDQKGLRDAWNTVNRAGRSDEVEAMRGWYQARFFERVFQGEPGRELLSTRRAMERMFSSAGPYAREKFDIVMGGHRVREDLLDVARLTDEFRKSTLKAEGSATFRRAAIGAVVTGAIGAIHYADQYFSNPFSYAPEVLGAVGIRVFLSSLLTGRLGRSLTDLSTGVARPTPGTSALPALAAEMRSRPEGTLLRQPTDGGTP